MQYARRMIIIVDFGSQYTQLIARRVRELNVYCETVPWNAVPDGQAASECAGYILSGGPASVNDVHAPSLPPSVLASGMPILGICYGMQWLATALGGRVSEGVCREYGPSQLVVLEDSPLFADFPTTFSVWMSHGDCVEQLPPNFVPLARTIAIPVAAIGDHGRRLFGVQFHPEVAHTAWGKELLRNFVYHICGCRGSWSSDEILAETVAAIQARVGNERALCAVSGGLDSTVAAVLTYKAIGERAMCVFVDHGLLRQGEAEHVLSSLRALLRMPVIGIDASNSFLAALRGITDPEQKRRAIGELFIRTFEAEADKLGGIPFLVQGTLYSDIIESAPPLGNSAKRTLAATIKSHHNVGGLPSDMKFKLVEPLNRLFKNEARRLGRLLGLPDEIVERHPFPGPGLAIRCLGEVTKDRLETLRKADAIVVDDLKASGLYCETALAFAVLLPVRSVGVMGDARAYGQVVAVRVVTSTDLMTADWARLPHSLLARISARITNEVPDVSRVVYDVTSKPPATIDWE